MYNVFYDNIILIPFLSFIIATILKLMILKVWIRKWSIEHFFWSGWMPSAHSCIAVSLSTAMLIKYWFNSEYFAITTTFTSIVIYDAVNVRFQAWLHATELNKRLWEEKFKESLWHYPIEALAWSILWIIIAVILSF